ncbi:Reducing polyketide synthase PKS1 [Metarhizium anisopliae]|nr:Reducing polyketide synthase PKS1 [Metarhizium anisopliae]
MLVVALEGASQLSDKSRTLYGYRFRDVSFPRGLIVPSNEEGAVKTSLSYTYLGTITVLLEYTSELQCKVEEYVVDVQWWEQRQRHQLLPNDDAAEFVDVDAFSDHFQKIGMEYGPLFRNVVSLQAIPSSKTSYGAVVIPETKPSMPEEFEYPHTMHAATMDTVFHLLLAAFNDGCPVDEAAVPYSISDMFVAADQPPPSAQLTQLCSLLHEGFVSINVTVYHRTLATIVNDTRAEGHAISLLEAESPLIYSWTEYGFEVFKKIISAVDYLLWVTRGYVLKAFAAGAEFTPSQGLLGVLRNEYTLITNYYTSPGSVVHV